MALAKKSRDADHLTNLVYDEGRINMADVVTGAGRGGAEPIPEYAYDVHTSKGRSRGKTKAMFFQDEHAALHPRQPGLFDHLVESRDPGRRGLS